jgi:hypothetical protein
MKRSVPCVVGLVFAGLVGLQLPAQAIPARTDVIWARQAPANTVITLDGVLNEPVWAQAEQKTIYYAKNNGDPGSGWQEEGGHVTRDSTRATARFLTVGNQLYMALTVPDSSIGGGVDFNRFDGILMSLKDHSALGFPKGPAEYFYSWWYPDSCDANPSAPGKLPDFHGKYGNAGPGTGRPTYCDPRTPGMIAAWDAGTHVQGTTNSDAVPDTGYTIEMRFSLDSLGYNVTQANGDVVEFNISVYDCDWFWPLNLQRFASNRAWWQSPWGNAMWYDEVQVWSKPSVTTTSGPVPSVPEEMDLHTIAGQPNITFDGHLNEPIWSQCDSLRITYADDALRATYPSIMKYRSGQYQPSVNGGTADVLDPGDMTVHWFFKADSLFLGFDVRDQYVQYVNLADRWDGVVTSINDRSARGMDRNIPSRNITFHIGPGGTGVAEDYLLTLRDTLNAAKFALALKPNTTVDTTGNDVDEGYQAELKIDLTKMGYPHGLGDGILWIGFTLYDGDSFTPSTFSYGTRTWFGREGQALTANDQCCPAMVYMNPNLVDVPIAGDTDVGFAIHGNSPNPFRASTLIEYTLDRPSDLTLEVYDLSGRRVATRSLGTQLARTGRYAFSSPGLKTGLYLYRLRAVDRARKTSRTSSAGKMMVLQ